MQKIARFNARKAEHCSHNFIHDPRKAGMWKAEVRDGHKYEEWREVCTECGTWIIAERIDGEMQ